MKASILLTAALLLAMVASGCAGREELAARSAIVPAGMELSGHWKLRIADQETMQRIDDAELAAAGGLESIVRGKRRQSGQRSLSPDSGALVHVFLEVGKELKITQTADGIFISFDRSIVEEYRFGEQRVISVGPIEADRASGWDNGAYVIETLDQAGAKLTEKYRLVDAGDELVRSISILHRGRQQLAIEQVFDRT